MPHLNILSRKLFSLLIGALIIATLTQCNESEDLPERLIIESTITNASAFGESDGRIELLLTGGEAPFTFYWDNGDSTQNIEGLSAGVYSCRIVYGPNGRNVAYPSFEVGQPNQEPLTMSSFTVIDASYHSANDGSITLNTDSIFGGTPPYKVLWESGDTLSFRLKLFAGEYSALISDSSPQQKSTNFSFTVSEPEFLCGRDSIIDVDGNRYATTQVAGQCWTRKNLKAVTYADGSPIQGINCYQNSCTSDRGTYYSWDAVVNGVTDSEGEDVQGVCPDGWHVPTIEEWTTLNDTLRIDGIGGEGTIVKEKVIGNGSSSGLDVNYYGFFGFTDILQQNEAIYWTSTQNSDNTSLGRFVRMLPTAFDREFRFGNINKQTGINCRCVKNEE